MKEYEYLGDTGSKTVIKDFEDENYIIVEKEGQPILTVNKHSIWINGVEIKKSKAENFLRAIRKNIIKEGLKNGTCKNV